MTDQLPDPTDQPDPEDADNIEYNPTQDRIQALAADQAQATEHGSTAYVSEYRSRCADRTWNTVDQDRDIDDDQTIETALADASATIEQYLAEEDLIAVDVRIGADGTVGRYLVPEEYARIAHSLTTLMEPTETDDPDFHTLQVPDTGETEIIADPGTGWTVVQGTDYTGEAKKSFLRQFMYDTKQQGGLGIHAGSKRVRIETEDGLETVGQVYQGLSGTGKSTLTAHGLWLDEPEETAMLQDDVCALLPDGSVTGTEGRGLYIKTADLDPTEQPELYEAATAADTVLENVAVTEDGTTDLDDTSLTSNGRAAVRRSDLDSAAEEIDLEQADQYFFITRNPLMPPAARLTDAQAAATFMLGESIETSAGDPERAGERVRVVGVNPFIIGPEGEEGNRFHELVQDSDIEPYLLNTGSVGDNDIGVEDTVALIEAITRGQVEWEHDPDTGLEVPTQVPDLDMDRFRPEQVIEDYAERLTALQDEREEYLAGFEELDEQIREAVY